MKKVSLLLAGMLILSVHILNAQSQTKDYFVGKWEISADTPSGTQKLLIDLKRVDGKLLGEITSDTDANAVKVTKVQENAQSVTLFFESSGYEIDLFMKMKNEDEITGSVFDDMFLLTGKRVKNK